jgi:drug/metabolite transporter (DMT)-like permease
LAVRRALALRLALAIALDTAVQLLWKVAAMELAVPLLLLVAALFSWQLINWLRVLEQSDLSYSQPVTSLSFVSVLVLSALYLGERIDALKVVGIILVLAGVWLICRGPHLTSQAEAAR